MHQQQHRRIHTMLVLLTVPCFAHKSVPFQRKFNVKQETSKDTHRLLRVSIFFNTIVHTNLYHLRKGSIRQETREGTFRLLRVSNFLHTIPHTNLYYLRQNPVKQETSEETHSIAESKHFLAHPLQFPLVPQRSTNGVGDIHRQAMSATSHLSPSPTHSPSLS